jgi:hypothetical protein
MATTHRAPSPAVLRLTAEGRLRPAKVDLATFLVERGPLEGDVSRAGSEAVLEERRRDGSLADRG